MPSSGPFLSPSEAARRLGISAKALRLYERRDLIAPLRTGAGWRAYGPEAMARAAEAASLRALGLGLAGVARVMGGDHREAAAVLAAHQAALEDRLRTLTAAAARVRALRADRAGTPAPPAAAPATGVAFDLPWPWGGERFVLSDVRALTYLVGPLGSGKTRLARRLAETLPDAVFLGLDRAAEGGAAARARLDADPALASRVERVLKRLTDDDAEVSPALISLLAGLEADGPANLVVDMVEQGLDLPTQQTLIAHLRDRGPGGRPLFLLTRSCAILDLAAVGADEAIIFCPANHSPPTRVAPIPGAPGYEAVATCLATPAVRARTEGVVAWRPEAA